MALLQFSEGERPILTYRLRGGRTVIGRSDRCDVALPSAQLSRHHCHVDEGDGWWLVDRSKHGTFVGGRRVSRHRLDHDVTFTVGPYSVRFVDDVPTAEATGARNLASADWEALVDVEQGPVTAIAVLEIAGGPLQGARHALERARVALGGTEADLCVDPDLPPDALTLHVVRGRVIARPGSRPAYLEGARLREPTPVWDGETLRLGAAELIVRAEVQPRRTRAATSFGDLVGEAPVMARLFGVLDRVSRHDAPVLLIGESGTGKELAARALHDLGARGGAPFIALNCASLPSQLVEAMLFGYEKGAFTGADARRDGAFQQADGGTLFLDELGEMSLDTQARLLRALESGEVVRLGASKPEHPDVRVVAATNRDLAAAVAAGTFRHDLYHRLAVLGVRLPPLREHLDDLPAITRALLARHHPGARITDAALATLAVHPWPGNVRELRNVLTRAVVLGGNPIDVADLSFTALGEPAPPVAASRGADMYDDADERQRLLDALAAAKGNRSQAARALGIPRTSLVYRLMRLGVE